MKNDRHSYPPLPLRVEQIYRTGLAARRRTHVQLSGVLTVCVLMVSAAAAASISGQLADSSGRPLEGARVILEKEDLSWERVVITNEAGQYSFEAIAPGSYTLSASKEGYVEESKTRFRLENERDNRVFDLRLKQAALLLEVRGEEELNPNVFVVKLDTNEILRQLSRRGANVQLIQEFRPDENYYGTTYGHPLRTVTFAAPIRRPDNWHASLYASHQNSALNARSFFTAGELLPSRRNAFGATFGMPLVSEKATLFFAWSGLRESGFVNGNILAPLENERTPRSSDPEVNAIIAKLLEGYPAELPNLQGRQLNTNAERDISNDGFSTQLDYSFRDQDKISVEQRFLDYSEDPFELVAGQNPVTLLRAQSVRLSHFHTFSASSQSSLSFNFDRLAAQLDVTERYQNLLSSLGIPVVPDIGVGGEWRSLGPGSSFPRRRVENRFHLAPAFIHTRENHTIAMGMKLTRFQINDLQSDQSRGSFAFSRDEGRSAVDNFLLGEATSFTIAQGNLYRGFRNWEHAFYLRDTIQVRPDFTLTLGLRYEIVTSPIEVNDLTDLPYQTDANNFGPQVGFAWSPAGGGTVLRGGYALTYGTIFPLLYQRARFNPPAIRTIFVPDPDLLDPLGGDAETKKSEVKQISPDLVVPYTHIFTLQLEQELARNTHLSLGYIGNRTIQLPKRVLTNRAEPVPGIEATTANINARRPDQRFLQVTTTANGVLAYFDAFQVSLSKRLTGGFSWDTRYTFSKGISTGATTFAHISTGSVSQSNELINDMKAVVDFDTPHAVTLNYNYEFPRFESFPVLRTLLGGWEVIGTTTFRSGTPMSVHTGSDSPGFGNVDGVNQPDRPNLLNPEILGQSFNHPDTAPNLLLRQYFDTNLPVGGRGDLGLYTFRIDGTNNWNLALQRNFRVGSLGSQDPMLEFRAEFINLFNRPQFDQPNNRIANDTFGQITNTANRGRIVQVTFRLNL